MKKNTSIHHLIPQSRARNYNDINTIKVNKKEHNHYHSFFENDNPHEAIVRVLDWNSPILEEATIDEIIDITAERLKNQMYYIKGINY